MRIKLLNLSDVAEFIAAYHRHGGTRQLTVDFANGFYVITA